MCTLHKTKTLRAFLPICATRNFYFPTERRNRGDEWRRETKQSRLYRVKSNMMRFNGQTISPYACTSQDAASLSAKNHLTMKHKLVMLINQRAALPHREAGNAQWCALKRLCFCYGFVSPYLVCQSRKFHLVQKCKCCKAQGHPPKREQWPQAGGGADSAFEPNQEALMCNL